MLLCLDIGNTQLYGGVFDNEKLKFSFRYDSTAQVSSDQLGVFFRQVLTENNIAYKAIKQIAICSVVPQRNYSLSAACIKYLNVTPFWLNANSQQHLQIQLPNAQELGADRIANAIGAIALYPRQNLILVDFGTATTYCAISNQQEYLGGLITPGFRLAMQALQGNTAQLPPVPIAKPDKPIGNTTISAIQAGLYYSQLATVKEAIQQFNQLVLNKQPALVVGTGGFAHLLEDSGLFDAIIPELVLHGLRLAVAGTPKKC